MTTSCLLIYIFFVAAQHGGIAAHQQMGDLDFGKCYLLLGLVLNTVSS